MSVSSRFLDPRILAGVRDLRLVARTVVEGFLAGQHVDARAGAGVEFSQYRAYQPGDDPRRIDWRALGRSDRYVVRESEVERDVTVRLLLDASASMAHARDGVVKFDVARAFAAVLAYLADRQGDALGFHALSDRAAPFALPRRRALDHLLHRLEGLEPAGRWPAWEALARQWPARRRRELVVLLSDLHDTDGAIDAALEALAAAGHEVIVFKLLARDELDFDFSGDLVFEDLETGETVRGRGEELRAAYLESFQADRERWRRRFAELGIVHQLVAMDEPFDEALRRFLLRRRELP